MSGIVGIYNLDGRPVERSDVGRMAATLERRGPDGTGLWCEGPVGLGHTMLWNSPESLHEQLPLVHARGDLAIISDARIDNRPELIHLLGFDGRDASQIGDSALILAAYEKWGEGCPARLLGDFAFAIWDGRRRVLFCARDHFGVTPFCYHRSDRLFVFASEVKAILAVPGVPRRINEGRIADYLVPWNLEGFDKTSTFYEEIFRFPPAHQVTVRAGALSHHRYWSLEPGRGVRYDSDGDYADAFREVFAEAVRCRLRSSVPPGIMMSGGLDSTSIVAVAQHLAGQNGSKPVRTFSAISSDEASCSETRCIQAMLTVDGLEPHTLRPDQIASSGANVELLVHHTDDLFDNWIIHIPFNLYGAGHQHGVNVMLDGVFGDRIVDQNLAYITFLLRDGKWPTAIAEAVGSSQRKDADLAPASTLWHCGRAAFVPEWGRELWHKVRSSTSPAAEPEDSILNPEFAHRVGVVARFEMYQRNERKNPARTLSEANANSLDSSHVVAALERYDRVAALHSIVPRHPFLDRRLVEFCLTIPWDQRVRRGHSKIALRTAMTGLLPEEVRLGEKWLHLGARFSRAWFLQEQELIEHVMHYYLDLAREYIDLAAVRRAYARYLNESHSDDWWHVWKAVTLALFLHRNTPERGGKGE